MPLRITGFVAVLTFTVQFTFCAPPCPTLPFAANGPAVELPVNPIVPGFFPCPLFQWYVVIETRQYALPFVLKLGGFAPFETPPPFVLSNSLIWLPAHVYFAGGGGGAALKHAAAPPVPVIVPSYDSVHTHVPSRTYQWTMPLCPRGPCTAWSQPSLSP